MEHQVGSRSGRWRVVFEVSTTLIMLAIGGTLVSQRWSGRTNRPSRPSTRPPSEAITIGSAAATKGSATANVVMIEYSEFECPFCATVAVGPLKLLDEKYIATGRVMLVFKHFPLSIHKLALGASVAAICAGAQGKFWQMHDILFKDPKRLTDPDLASAATQLGLQPAAYKTCRSASDGERLVASDKAEGDRLGVTATPTFFIGTRLPGDRLKVTDVMIGARNISEFNEVFDRLLSKSSQ